MRELQPIVAVSIIIFLLSGCAAGFMNSYSYDPNIGESTKTSYSPLFVSDSLSLAEEAEFRVSVVITRRVEPISYSLLGSVGGLTSEDLESKATAVVHFKNDSQQIYRVNLRKLVVLNQEFPIRFSEIVLKPGDRFDTKVIPVKAPTYDTIFNLDLFYELDGKSFKQEFFLRRQTMGELRNLDF